jgi:hypothetical protein
MSQYNGLSGTVREILSDGRVRIDLDIGKDLSVKPLNCIREDPSTVKGLSP